MGPQAVQSDGQTMFFRYDVGRGHWSWSAGLRALHGLGPAGEPTTELMLDRMVEEDRAVVLERFDAHLRSLGPFSCVYRMRDPDDHVRRLIFVGRGEGRGEGPEGAVEVLSGFVVDLTEPWQDNARVAVAASVEHRAAIEQAKGALMLSFGIEEDAAFGLLRAYSNQHNVKLAVVAERIVAGLSAPEFSRDEPVRSLLDIVIGLKPQPPSCSDRGTASMGV